MTGVNKQSLGGFFSLLFNQGVTNANLPNHIMCVYEYYSLMTFLKMLRSEDHVPTQLSCFKSIHQGIASRLNE